MRASRGTWLFVLLSCASCNSAPADPVDEEWIDSTLGPAERIDWPGVERGDGRRIPFIRGFGEGEASGYWFLGAAREETIDSFWFCREGEEACPFNADGTVDRDRAIGAPVFSSIPGEFDYSPYWLSWV